MDNMMEYSYIETSAEYSSTGHLQRINHKIIGNSPYVRIFLDVIYELGYDHAPDTLILGKVKMYLINRTGDVFNYAISNRLGRLRVWLHKITDILDLIYRRSIITLSVWGAAEIENGSIPSWRDIKVFKKYDNSA
jgi:hypothetical protein